MISASTTDARLGGNDTLSGGASADALIGGAGADAITGDDGSDAIAGDAAAVTLDLRILGGSGSASPFALAPSDPTVGGNDVLFGGTGDDLIVGQGGNDTLLGEGGDDTLFGDYDLAAAARPSGADLVTGDDLIVGGDGGDTLRGGAGADQLLGGGGDDDLNGGTGTGASRPGTDIIRAGTGFSDRIASDFDDGLGQTTTTRFTFESTADFTEPSANPFQPRVGSWAAGDGQYTAHPGASGALAIQTLAPNGGALDMQATVHTRGLAGLVFDYRGSADFTYAAIDTSAGLVVVGRPGPRGSWETLASAPMAAQADRDLVLAVSVRGRVVTVFANGQAILKTTLAAQPNASAVGLIARDGTGNFDDVLVRGNAPSLADDRVDDSALRGGLLHSLAEFSRDARLSRRQRLRTRLDAPRAWCRYVQPARRRAHRRFRTDCRSGTDCRSRTDCRSHQQPARLVPRAHDDGPASASARADRGIPGDSRHAIDPRRTHGHRGAHDRHRRHIELLANAGSGRRRDLAASLGRHGQQAGLATAQLRSHGGEVLGRTGQKAPEAGGTRRQGDRSQACRRRLPPSSSQETAPRWQCMSPSVCSFMNQQVSPAARSRG